MAKGKVVSGTPVRSVKYQNGNQGFSPGIGKKLGSDTQPGPGPGAPLSSVVQQTVTSKKVDPTGMNRLNQYEGDGPGVLGAEVSNQDAGKYRDSPVPVDAVHPDLRAMTKADESANAQARTGDVPKGTLGR
jgi:hypothetical protein